MAYEIDQTSKRIYCDVQYVTKREMKKIHQLEKEGYEIVQETRGSGRAKPMPINMGVHADMRL